MSAFCYTTIVSGFSVETTKEFRRMNIGEPTVEQCTHCRMFGHLVDQCAMLTGEYDDEDYDEEYVDYYEEYDKLRRTSFSGVSSYSFSYASRILHNYLDSCDNDPISPMELADKDEVEWNENVLTEEEYAEWMREAAEEDEYADYHDDHSPEADVRWVKHSSMAAFDHFQRTGSQLKNSEFVGKKAGAPLRSELGEMDE